MKKLPYVCFGMLIMGAVLLSVYIMFQKPKENTYSFDIVPNEIVAKQIADIVIETQIETLEIEHKKDLDYSFEITFDEKNNEWKVYYFLVSSDPNVHILGGDMEVYIRRDNGMVTNVIFWA